MTPFELSAIRVAELSVPTIDPFVIASGVVHATRSIEVTVEVKALDGRTEQGLGEGACLPPVTREDQPEALREALAAVPELIGQRFDSLDGLERLLDAVLLESPVARSAIEVAVLDAWARLDQLPLAIWVNRRASTSPLETDITIPILEPERMAQLAGEWWARGFRALKIKVGKNLDDDLRALEAMLRVTPHARFRPDANAGLTVRDALAFVAGAQRLGATLECFEQPCASLDEMAEVCARLELPVLADESVKTLEDFEKVVETRAADGVNLKIAKSGSWLRAHRIGLAANAKQMPVMVGGMVETRLGMTAATHLAAALGGVAFCDLDTAWLLERDLFIGGYEADGPRYTLPTTPGLSVAERSEPK